MKLHTLHESSDARAPMAALKQILQKAGFKPGESYNDKQKTGRSLRVYYDYGNFAKDFDKDHSKHHDHIIATNKKIKEIDSNKLVTRVKKELESKGYEVASVEFNRGTGKPNIRVRIKT